MGGYGDRAEIEHWLRYYDKKIEPDAAFWAKADKYGLNMTYYAIRKADQEEQFTIEHITALIGNVVKENDRIVYKMGVNRNDISAL